MSTVTLKTGGLNTKPTSMKNHIWTATTVLAVALIVGAFVQWTHGLRIQKLEETIQKLTRSTSP